MRSCGLCGKIRDDSPHLCMADVVNLLNGAFSDDGSKPEAPREAPLSQGLLGSMTSLGLLGQSGARA